MTNRIIGSIKLGAARGLDAVMFGFGLVEGAARGVIGRVRREDRPPQETPRPSVPSRPTPDPYDLGVATPVGTTGAAPAYNPSTAESDLQQPGTEEIMEPSTTKRIKSEAEMMRKAAERNPDA
jgi:hypothetical protein